MCTMAAVRHCICAEMIDKQRHTNLSLARDTVHDFHETTN